MKGITEGNILELQRTCMREVPGLMGICRVQSQVTEDEEFGKGKEWGIGLSYLCAYLPLRPYGVHVLFWEKKISSI